MLEGKRYALLAAALAVAAPAGAQVAQPRPAPAPDQTTAQRQAAAAQASPQLAQDLSKVQTMIQNTVQVAQVAQKKAQSPAAKNLANQVVKQYQAMGAQLQSLAKQRGVTLDKNPEAASMQGDLQAVLKDLGARSGADFDRQYIAYEEGGFQNFQQAMKEVRDRTPGSDSQVKSWLDQAENVTEDSLTMARQARQQVASGQ